MVIAGREVDCGAGCTRPQPAESHVQDDFGTGEGTRAYCPLCPLVSRMHYALSDLLHPPSRYAFALLHSERMIGGLEHDGWPRWPRADAHPGLQELRVGIARDGRAEPAEELRRMVAVDFVEQPRVLREAGATQRKPDAVAERLVVA